MYMQLFDEDKSREELICEGEIDLTNVLREGEEDRKQQDLLSRPQNAEMTDKFDKQDGFLYSTKVAARAKSILNLRSIQQ